MTYIVGENCILCKHTDCVSVCPVDCFYEGENFLVISPVECIDCDDCVDACPVDAIYSEDDVPEGQEKFIDINAELAEAWSAANITDQKPPLPDAEKWNGVADKLKYLVKKPL